MKRLLFIISISLASTSFAALPTILVNSATGSDSAASGAGPSTAITGSTISTNATGLVVTLNGSPDLTNVSTDGSHVLWINDTISGNRNFAKITAKDGSLTSTASVTVSDAYAVNMSSTIAWAIGGKRASLFNGSSKLFLKDTDAGWIVEMESGHTETYTGGLDRVGASPEGNTTSGRIIFRGSSGAATMPVVTNDSGSTNALVIRESFFSFQDFEFVRGASGSSYAITGAGASKITISGMVFRNWNTNGTLNTIGAGSRVYDCEFSSSSIGITGSFQNGVISNNYFHDGTSAMNLSTTLSGLLIYGNVIEDMSADCISINNTRDDGFGSHHIINNIIYDCGGDGIESVRTPNTITQGGSSIYGNVISGAGGYGLNFSNAAASTTTLHIVNSNVDFNAYYNNTSGHRNNINAGPNDIDLTADPFVNVATADYNLNNTSGGGTGLRSATDNINTNTSIYPFRDRVSDSFGGGASQTSHTFIGP